MKAKRLTRAQERITKSHHRQRIVEKAYGTFLQDGTLPSDRSLAGAVLHRALHARKPVPAAPEQLEQAAAGSLWQPYGTTREMLFREAVCGVVPVQEFARNLISAVVQAGHDPTDPELFGPELEPMDFEPVCLRLVDWPGAYVRPEYQSQLQRVQRQQAEVRSLRPLSDTEWDRDAGAALAAFLNRGHIPTDSRFYLYVLSMGELFALTWNYFGRGGEDLLAAYAAVATSTGDHRIEALRVLGALQVRWSEAVR